MDTTRGMGTEGAGQTDDGDDGDDGAQRRHPAPDPALPHLFVDFNDLGRRADGVEVIDAGWVEDAGLRRLGLVDGMSAVFEQPGELQMTGVLRRRTGPAGDYWEGQLVPASLVFHVRIAEQSLYYAGPEGCSRYQEFYPRPPDHGAGEDEEEHGAGSRAGSGAGSGEGREEWDGQWELRPQLPAAALTIGVEGTFEQWYRALAGTIPSGERVLAADGEPIVLVDDQREVDARMRILRLPPEPDAEPPAAGRGGGRRPPTFPQGRRVWLAEPDWSTLRRIPWPSHAPAQEASGEEGAG